MIRRLRDAALVIIGCCAIGVVGCGGADDATKPVATSTLASNSATVRGATPKATAVSSTPVVPRTAAVGATVEVTGIVGTVSASTRTLEIRRLQGSQVTRLEIAPDAVIRKAAGGSARFGDIRTSDRIIARGTLNERGDAMVVSEITVQDTLPGAEPGG